MSIFMDLSASHDVVSANSHYYPTPTPERYIDRTLAHHDLIYILDGDWAIAESGQDYQLQKGDVLLLSAGKRHYTRRPCQAGTRTFCIHINCLETDRQSAPSAVELPTLLHVEREPHIRQYFEQIVNTQWSDQPHKKERLSSLVQLLLLDLAALRNSDETPQTTLADQAIALITASPHKRITAQDAAKQLGVSEKTLTNAMQKKTGMAFYTYQKNLKLEMIADQLKSEIDLRICDISDAFGFHDEFHLSNAFKKKYGVSPQRYRQLHTQEEK